MWRRMASLFYTYSTTATHQPLVQINGLLLQRLLIPYKAETSPLLTILFGVAVAQNWLTLELFNFLRISHSIQAPFLQLFAETIGSPQKTSLSNGGRRVSLVKNLRVIGKNTRMLYHFIEACSALFRIVWRPANISTVLELNWYIRFAFAILISSETLISSHTLLRRQYWRQVIVVFDCILNFKWLSWLLAEAALHVSRLWLRAHFINCRKVFIAIFVCLFASP
jgi:hypothetical protein